MQGSDCCNINFSADRNPGVLFGMNVVVTKCFLIGLPFMSKNGLRSER